jgi:hypothetical protein
MTIEEDAQPKTPLPHKPHRLLAGFMAAENERAAQAKRNGWARPEKHADTEIGRRVLQMHEALLKAGEERGYKPEVPKDKNSFGFLIDGQNVSWRIREGYKRRQVVLEGKEARDPFNISMGRTSKQVDTGTGLLIVFLTARYASDIRIEEKAGKPFSGRVQEILDRMKASATYAAQRQEEDNIAWRQRVDRQEAARRYEILLTREESRWAQLRQASNERVEIERLRATVALIQDKTAGITQPRLSAWLEWADARISAQDIFSLDGSAIYNRLIAKPRAEPDNE